VSTEKQDIIVNKLKHMHALNSVFQLSFISDLKRHHAFWAWYVTLSRVLNVCIEFIRIDQYDRHEPQLDIGSLLCGYFKNFEMNIIILNRALRYFCFKLVGKCQFTFKLFAKYQFTPKC